MNRLRPSLGLKVGLRLGFGLRDENSETILHFVTYGYLVKLIAHHPNYFERHTHIIFDEVHERSIDADLLCLFSCQLMDRFPNLRVVLMSATPYTDLYKNYFRRYTLHDRLESLHVGFQRFPIKRMFVEDIIAMAEGREREWKRLAVTFGKLKELTARCDGRQSVSMPNKVAAD